MKRLLAAFAVALALLGSQLAISVVLHAAVTVGTGTKIAYTSNATSIASTSIDTTTCAAPCAYAIMVCGITNSGTAPTDGQSHTYVGTTESGGRYARLWIALNVTTSATYQYTLHSSSGAYLSSIMVPLGGVKSASAIEFDTTPTNGSGGSSLASNTLTPGEANTILLGGSADEFNGRTHTGSASFTEVDEYAAYSTGFNAGCSLYYDNQTTATARTLTVTFSGTQTTYGVVLVNLKMQPAAGAARPAIIGSGIWQGATLRSRPSRILPSPFVWARDRDAA